MSNPCRIFIMFNDGHTNQPVSPAECSRRAYGYCGVRGRPVLYVNTCWNGRTMTDIWRRGDTCYVIYKCSGCFFECGNQICPGPFC